MEEDKDKRDINLVSGLLVVVEVTILQSIAAPIMKASKCILASSFWWTGACLLTTQIASILASWSSYASNIESGQNMVCSNFCDQFFSVKASEDQKTIL